MGRLRNGIICAGAALSITVGGCDRKGKAMVDSLAILPPDQLTKSYYDDTTNLVKRLTGLAKEFFPQKYYIEGGMIYFEEIEEIEEEEHRSLRYVHIDISEENGVETLTLTSYGCSDSELEAEVNEYLLDHKYEEAKEALGKRGLPKLEFYDYAGNGLKPNTDDLLTKRDREGRSAHHKDSRLYIPLRKVSEGNIYKLINDAYRWFLKKTIAALEKELEARGENITGIDKDIYDLIMGGGRFGLLEKLKVKKEKLTNSRVTKKNNFLNNPNLFSPYVRQDRRCNKTVAKRRFYHHRG